MFFLRSQKVRIVKINPCQIFTPFLISGGLGGGSPYLLTLFGKPWPGSSRVFLLKKFGSVLSIMTL